MLDLYYKVYFLLSSEKPRLSLIFCSYFRQTNSSCTVCGGLGVSQQQGLEAVEDRRTRAQHFRAWAAPAATPSLAPRSDFLPLEKTPLKGAVRFL